MNRITYENEKRKVPPPTLPDSLPPCKDPVGQTILPLLQTTPCSPRGSAVIASLLKEIFPMMSSCLWEAGRRRSGQDPHHSLEPWGQMEGLEAAHPLLASRLGTRLHTPSTHHAPNSVFIQHIEGQVVEVQWKMNGVLLPPKGAQAPPDGCCPAREGLG